VIGILALGVIWRAWRRSAPILVRETLDASVALGRRKSVWAAGLAAKEIALNGGMRECEDAQQWAAHQLIMWGFIGLFATTSLDALVNPAAEPLPLLHPVRLLGNVTGIAFMMGLTLAIARRALLAHVRASSHLRDWTFLLSLWGTGATGFAVQWLADASRQQATAWLYALHLVFVAGILAAAPWTKFIHAAWRPTWVLYRALTTARRT
jgi:nitrate reductase gamma subunit